MIVKKPAKPNRAFQIADQIQRDLAELIREVKDPRLGMVTMNSVEVTPDYAHAKIFFSVLVGEPPNVWFCRDTDGDGVCDKKEQVFNDFGSKNPNPEHMANGAASATNPSPPAAAAHLTHIRTSGPRLF